MKQIDLRSDTVTIPTENMRKAMLNFQTSDDLNNTDPTVLQLEKLAADMVGKEDAVFVPSGTMGNQLAILVYGNAQKGNEIIVGEFQHIAWDENASHSVICGSQLRTLPQKKTGEIDLQLLDNTIRKNRNSNEKSQLQPKTSVICLENTFHGVAIPLSYFQNVQKISKNYGIPIHIDGARLFNAVHALGIDVKELASTCDSLQFCLSKGLCCPIGSLLVGSKKFCEEAKKYRKMLGGTMRLSGLLAGPGIIALKEVVPQLNIDHQIAQLIHQKLSYFSTQLILEEYTPLCTNMIYFKFKKSVFNKEKSDLFVNYMANKQIKINGSWEPSYDYRLVVHQYIREKQVQVIIDCIKEFLDTIYIQ